MKNLIGYILFITSFTTWAAIAILPFFNLSILMAASIASVLVITGEIAFFLSIVLLGKEFLDKNLLSRNYLSGGLIINLLKH